MKTNSKKPDQRFEEAVKIVLHSSIKDHLVKYFRSLTLSEQIELLNWANVKTAEQFYRYVRNHVENLSR